MQQDNSFGDRAASYSVVRRASRIWPPLVALAVIAVATLAPLDADAATGPFFCLLCGSRGLADALLNILLFVPFGVVLGHRGLRAVRAILLGFAVSVTVEAIQVLLPGRDATLGDIVFNTVGAAFGWLLTWRAAAWLRPAPPAAGWLGGAAVAAALCVLAAGALLLRPSFPANTWYGQWTPEFKTLEHYDGHVVAAHAGDIRIRSAAIRRSTETRRRVLSGVPLQVTAVAGSPPVALAPIFNLYDERQREIVLLGAEREDLVFRYRARTSDVRLDAPALRMRQAFRNIERGDTIRLTLQRVGNGFCIDVNTRRTCPIGFAAADLWKLLMAADPRSPVRSRLLDVIWLCLLFVPAGYWLNRRHALLAAGFAIAGLVMLSLQLGLLMPSPLDLVAATAGLGAGGAARAVIHARMRASTSADTQRSMRA